MTGAYNTYGDFRSNKFHGVDFSIRHNSGVALMEELGYSPEPLRQMDMRAISNLADFMTPSHVCNSRPARCAVEPGRSI